MDNVLDHPYAWQKVAAKVQPTLVETLAGRRELAEASFDVQHTSFHHSELVTATHNHPALPIGAGRNCDIFLKKRIRTSEAIVRAEMTLRVLHHETASAR